MASAWEETKKKVLAKSAWQQTRQKVLNESRNYEAPAAQNTAAPTKTPSTTQSSLEAERSRILSGVTDRTSAARALDEVSRLSKLIDYSGATYEDKFTGQFGASYAQGRLSQDASLAWDQYLSSPTAENRKKAEEASEVLKQFQTRNEKTLDDDATLSWVSQSLAGYLPQLADQTKYSAAGATVGGIAGSAVPVVGTAAGIKAGIVAGSGAYSFSTMRGAAFKDLLDLGVDEKTARELATDEAVISSLIEMADTGVDIATLGVGKVINVAAKGGLKSLVKSGAGEAVEKAGKKLLSAVKKYGGKAGVQYALNIGGEMLEEGAQQSVSIANRERAANRNTSGVTGLLGETVSTAWDAATGKDTDARTEIWEAMKEGGKIAAMMGGATMVGTNLIQRGLGKSESASKEVAPSPVEQPKVEKAVDKAQTVSYDKTVETTEVTVENKATSLYAALGMKLKKAEAKAAVVQKLIDGKEVTRGELLSLNLSDAKYQAIFTELTGVTFEKGMNDDQRFNAARTAHEVRKSVVSEPQMVQESVIPDEVAAEVPAAVEPVAAEPEDRLPTFEEFSGWYRAQNDKELTDEQVGEAYNQFVGYESETVTDESGTYTRAEFRNAIRTSNPGLTDRAINQYFDYYKSEKAKSVAQEAGGQTRARDLRDHLSKKTQKILADVENRLGVDIEIVDSIYVEKAGKFAEGEHSGARIRLALNARGQLTRDEAILQLLRHELTHHLQEKSPKVYKQFVDFVIENMPDYQTRFDARAKAYKDVIDESQKSRIDDEVVAQYAEMLFTDEEFIETLVRLDRSLAEKIVDAIKDLVTLLTDSSLTDLQKTAMQAQRKWEKALAEAAKENAAKAGVVYDEKTESFSPTYYSMETWNESDYVTARAAAAKDMAEALGITQKKAKAYIDSVNSIAKMIANDRVRLDYEASPGRSSFVSNSEYGGSIDFSTICKKRRLFTGTFEAIQRALPNTALTAEEFLEIRSMMDEKGYEVSCGLCYVEGSRANMGQYAKQFLEQYANTNPEYLPNMAEINTPAGLEGIRSAHPEVYAAYEKFMNGLAQRKPKLYQTATAYQGEVLNKFGRKGGKVDEKNYNGGLRLQSFSDFEIIHLIDCMQVIMDMSRVGLAGQAYTKVPDFAWALGDTGLKINLSLITNGVDSDGRIILDEKEGMSAEDAFALRDRYSENVGTVLVVFSDEQLRAAMADDRIDYVLPFHRSQWRKDQYESMGLPADAKDYTPWQNESYIKPVLSKSGKKQRPDNFMPNTYWDFNKTGKENAETYLKMCAEGNRKPKFSHLLVDNKDGSYSLQPDGSTDGYWKLLIDFKMYDNTGKGMPQRPVRPDFNMEQANRMLEDYKGGHSRFPAADDVVTEFVERYKRNHPDVQYSFADEVASQTEEEYNAVRELQAKFDGTVAATPGIKLSGPAKAGIASAILTGNFQLSANGKIGGVNFGNKCYLFEPFDDGGLYVYDVKTHQELNDITMNYRTGGNYGRNQRTGQNPAGARSTVPVGATYYSDGEQKSAQDDPLAERESGSDRSRDGDEGVGAEQSPVSDITYGSDYAHWRNAVKGGPDYSLADDLTPELREEFVKSFDAQFGEGAAEAMFKTHDQMVRAARRAKVKAKTTEESAAAERALAQRRRENAMLAWEIHHKKTLREQQRKYNDALAKERKAKAEAVADTKQVEQAKADIRVQATEMNLGKKAAEKERTLKDRMVEQKEKAAERLRVTKDAYKGRMAERTKLQRTAAKRLLSDKKAVEKRKAEIEAQQGPVDTIRKSPKERTSVEKLKAMAEELRTRGRTAYRYFVNQAQEIDNFAKRQRGGVYASTLVNVLGGSGSTVETIFKNGLVDRSGNRIAGSLKEALLCMDPAGKKVDEAKQALLQDYILHLHNIDRMSFVANARARLDAFEIKPENNWLVDLDPKELAILVAATDAETADAIFKKNGKVKGNKGWTDADRQLAWEYASLLNAYREAQDKPVFGDENGNPVTAETSREIVAKYEAENAWLVDKADGVFKWWDLFMRTWAVGDSLSLAEYETMHQTYPHYAPTYRVDKAGPGGVASISGRAATVSKATKAAKGSTLEIVPIEDSFANIASKIVRMARVNELYMNIIDTAMLDDEGLFSDMAVFDWDWQMGAYEQALQIQAMLNGETAAEIENASKVGLEKDGANYKLTGWKDGRKYSAYISQDLYQSIADTTGATDEKLKTLTQLGNTLTGPMKTAITGVNPFFAIRNLSRDIPSAIINSTGGKFPKYWAKAIAEMKSNSENWQAFKALGGINAGYYNNEKGFVNAMSRGPGVVSTTIDALGTVNNATEAATRFAEYLSTIDRMGDTYEARLQGIKNSAEVTVDFSRKGSYGKFINAWVPYWNPAVQGIDKMLRSVIDSPDGSAVWKQATKTLSRAALCTVLTEAVLQAVLHGLDRDDEWEELSDRDKATYYCIPLPNEHKFLKIAKNREWGAILGTPFMLILEGLDGRQNPFENYVETSLEPNFMPGAILRPREGGGFTSDIIGVSQALDLAYNEDFAGRTIIPYAQQQGSLTEQYDSETSMFSRVLGDLFNFSPMQLDYIIQDYFGDFGDVFTNLTAPATWSADSSPADTAASAWDTFTSSFFADNRYSNQTVSNYYETLDELSKVVNDKKNQMGTEAHKQTKEYKTQKGLQELYGNQITELNKEVRGLPDGPDKDARKEQIAQLAGQALEFYKESMSGGISEPLLTATYANLPSSVSNELIRLDNFAADYSFEPSTYKPTKYTDPKDKSREYVLDDDAKAQYRTIYDATYAEVMDEAMGKHSYQKANDQKKVEMLEEARDSVTELTKERFLDWLADNRRSTEKTK